MWRPLCFSMPSGHPRVQTGPLFQYLSAADGLLPRHGWDRMGAYKAGSVTGALRFREAAVEALQYERGCSRQSKTTGPIFVLSNLRLPNLRTRAFRTRSPGAMALLHWPRTDIDARTLPGPGDLRRDCCGSASHSDSKPGINYSLCHGDLGNYETLVHAAKIIPDSVLRDRIRLLPSLILSGIRQHGWKCGVPLGVETPGLMVGVAESDTACCAWPNHCKYPRYWLLPRLSATEGSRYFCVKMCIKAPCCLAGKMIDSGVQWA